MTSIYYRIWTGYVISFCFLVVSWQQILGVLGESTWRQAWLFPYQVVGTARRELTTAEAEAYAQGQARVSRQLRKLAWGGILAWWVWTVLAALGRGAGAEVGMAHGMVGLWCGVHAVRESADPSASALAAWQVVDAQWQDQLAEGEEVVWVSDDKNQLSSLRRMLALEVWCVQLWVETTEKALVYVRADRRQKGLRHCPTCGQVAIGWKDKKGYDAVRDYPLRGRPWYLMVAKQSYRCTNWDCERASFTAVGDLVDGHGRMTGALACELARASSRYGLEDQCPGAGH